MSILQFEPLSSAIEASFWHKLAKNKLDSYQLDDSEKTLVGFYEFQARSSTLLPARLNVTGESFEPSIVYHSKSQEYRLKKDQISVKGSLKNTNTIESFKELNKNDILNTLSEKVRVFVAIEE